MNNNRLADDKQTNRQTREDQQTSTTNYNQRLTIYVTVNLTTCSIRQVSQWASCVTLRTDLNVLGSSGL
jgi:hypothetical protein